MQSCRGWIKFEENLSPKFVPMVSLLVLVRLWRNICVEIYSSSFQIPNPFIYFTLSIVRTLTLEAKFFEAKFFKVEIFVF